MDARTGQGRGVTVVVVFVGSLADSNSSSNDKPGCHPDGNRVSRVGVCKPSAHGHIGVT
jgi:hypothetical protein